MAEYTLPVYGPLVRCQNGAWALTAVAKRNKSGKNLMAVRMESSFDLRFV